MPAMVTANLGYVLVGAIAVRFEHEGRVRIAIAWLVGLFSIVFLRIAWRSARTEDSVGARVLVAGVAGVLSAFLLVAAVEIIVGSWGGNGVIAKADLAEVFLGETRSAVHDALGKPFQHSPGDAPGEDCDVYEASPGLQGGLYADVCYLGNKVSRIIPFR